jgi:uncharacterized membrane protein YeaQ/YmgE (transglycosylase-associated protein family)
MGFLWTILIGAAIGALATFSRDRSACVVNTVLGSLGGLAATYLGEDFGWNGPNDGAGPVGAVIGAVLLIAIGRAFAAGPATAAGAAERGETNTVPNQVVVTPIPNRK